MIISARDDDWQLQIFAALDQRVEFEWQDLDELNQPYSYLLKLAHGWGGEWKFTLTANGSTSFSFRPSELPEAAAIWNVPEAKSSPRLEA